MKRKIIKQGNQSLTLTLPINWVRENSLGEGKEIEIVPSGNLLIVSAGRTEKKRKISLELSGVDDAVKKLISSLYRAGYDEIEVKFDEPEIGKYINQIVLKQLVGFEVIVLGEKHYLIKDIADLDPESFDVLFRKCFLLLINFKNEISQTLREKDREGLEGAKHTDLEINKSTNLCLRLLNKKLNDRKKIAILASVLKGIENLGDEFKYLIEHCLGERRFPSAEALGVLEEIGGKLNEIYSLFYKFELEKNLKLAKELRVIKQGLKALKKGEIQRYLHSIIGKLELISEGPMVLNINPEEKIRKEDWVN